MTSFLSNALGGNPFSTPVGARIEQATDGSLASENWALNMEICDLVNETEDGPKDAIRAIRKRLQQNVGKKYNVVMYTLTVLETCVKNCGKRFHLLVCNKDFIQELVKLIGPKNDPPTAVQEKVLSLIQSWADAFKNQPELSGVTAVYQDLLNKGIEFPPADLDAMAPILTPQRSVDREPQGVREILIAPSSGSPLHGAPSMVSGGGLLTPEQRSKLQSEIDIVQTNMAIFGEMLSESQPDKQPSDSELELLQDLNDSCQRMQDRIIELVNKLSNDELTADLLRINDHMNMLFLRYNRWGRNRGIATQKASAVLAKAMGPPQTPAKQEQEESLIDFESNTLPDRLSKLDVSGNSASAQLANVSTITAKSGSKGDDEFDTFAQLRKSSFDQAKPDHKANLEPEQVSGNLSLASQIRTNRDSDFDEMEAWLEQTPATEESMTSSEFEKFLEERAAAAEALPTVAPQTNPNTNRKAPKDKKEGLISL